MHRGPLPRLLRSLSSCTELQTSLQAPEALIGTPASHRAQQVVAHFTVRDDSQAPFNQGVPRQHVGRGTHVLTDLLQRHTADMSGTRQSATSATSGGTSRLEFRRARDSQAQLDSERASTGGHEWEEDSREREARILLLDTALKHVKDKGWTLAAVQAAAQDLGLSPAFAASLERGPAELVEHFVQKSNEEYLGLVTKQKRELENLRLRERIALLVKWRLQLTAPFIDSWPQAMAIQAKPANITIATRQLALLVDDMWHTAGDTATDYNWYTKRALLAGIYTTTELYMLTDYSPGLTDTWEALDRRVRDVMRIGRMAGEMSRAVQQGADGLRSFASWLHRQTAPQHNPHAGI